VLALGLGFAVAVLVTGVAVVGAARSSQLSPDVAAAAAGASSGATSSDARWRGVLGRLDAIRARAWRAGDPSALDRVYVAGSGALRADKRMIDAFGSRGWRPDEVRLELLAVSVVDRRPGEVTLAAVDRLRPVRVHTDVGGVANLPADEPTAHRIVLRRVEGRWLIADVIAR
jgi:hypothetical protein